MKKLHLNYSRILLHILFWLVYLPLNAVLTCILYRLSIEESFWDNLIGEAFTLPVKIALTYFIFYYIIPLYLERNKVGQLVALLLTSFAVTMLLYRLSLTQIYLPLFEPERHFDLLNARGLYLTAFDIFITIAAAGTIKLIRLHYRNRDLQQQLVSEKLQSELNFLRAQTNPHFLFNTLNNLYVLAWKKSDHTAEAIMKLSKIMRFLLYDCRAPRIPLADEARVIGDYIELEKLRYNDRLRVRYEQDLDQPDARIAPLLLLPFVENSFKHGAHGTAGEAEIHIHLQLKNNELRFRVENTDEQSLPQPFAQGKGESNGIGLKNVQRQLDLLYPDRYRLNITRADGLFKTELSILLPEEV